MISDKKGHDRKYGEERGNNVEIGDCKICRHDNRRPCIGAFTHSVYACSFRIACHGSKNVGLYVSMETIIRTSKMQCNAENEWINGMRHVVTNCVNCLLLPWIPKVKTKTE